MVMVSAVITSEEEGSDRISSDDDEAGKEEEEEEENIFRFLVWHSCVSVNHSFNNERFNDNDPVMVWYVRSLCVDVL